MLDPYATVAARVELPDGVQVVPPNLAKRLSDGGGFRPGTALLGGLAALLEDFDWRGAARPRLPMEATSVLELDPVSFTSGSGSHAVRGALSVCLSAHARPDRPPPRELNPRIAVRTASRRKP
jgi:hypothetical protein